MLFFEADFSKQFKLCVLFLRWIFLNIIQKIPHPTKITFITYFFFREIILIRIQCDVNQNLAREKQRHFSYILLKVETQCSINPSILEAFYKFFVVLWHDVALLQFASIGNFFNQKFQLFVAYVMSSLFRKDGVWMFCQKM